MNYVIEHNQTFGQYIKIIASFKVNHAPKTILTFPNWRPGRYELANFAKNIKNFKITDQNNKAVEFKKITSNQWELITEHVKAVDVSYFFYAHDLNAGSTYVDDQQLYVNPVNCLIYSEALVDEPCQLKLKIKSNYKIASGLPFDNNHLLKTENYHELVDNPFIASDSLQHNSYTLNGVTFHLWFQGLVEVEWDRVMEDFIKFTRLQLKTMSGFPVNNYHFLFQILAVPAYHGVEHQHSTVIALGPTHQLMGTLYDDFLGVSSHELYHTWNVKAIRPKDMYPYNYNIENYTNLGYVAEGVTTYLGDLFLCASGVKTWQWYRTELEQILQKHFDNFGRFNYSVAESSWDTWIDGYEAGVPHRKVSIYNEGALLALILDIKIRNNTSNKASIHDVMHKLYHEFALKNKGYTDQDFIQIAGDYANENLQSFFETYYYSANALESILTKTFENIGLEIKMEFNPNYAERLLGIKYKINNGKTVVDLTYPGSSADMGFLLQDDEIVSINDINVSSDFDKWVSFFKDKQIVLTVSRKGRLVEIICPNTNRNYYPIYKIVKPKITSNLSKTTFRRWCGYKWDEI